MLMIMMTNENHIIMNRGSCCWRRWSPPLMNRLCRPGSPFRFSIPVCQISQIKKPKHTKPRSELHSEITVTAIILFFLVVPLSLSIWFLSLTLTHFWFSLSLSNTLQNVVVYRVVLLIPYFSPTFSVCFLVGSSRIEVTFLFTLNCFFFGAEWVMHEAIRMFLSRWIYRIERWKSS